MAFTTRYVSTTGTDTYANSTSSSTPCSLSTAVSNAAAGDWFKVAAGTYSRSASDTVTNAGTITSPIVWEGCDASWNSITPTRANNGTGVLDASAMPVIAYASGFRLQLSAFSEIFHCKLTGSIGSNAAVLLLSGTGNQTVRRCYIENTATGTGPQGIQVVGANVSILDCDVFTTGASGSGLVCAIYSNSSTDNRVSGCRISSVAGHGILCGTGSGSGLSFVSNQIYKCGLTGVTLGAGSRGLVFGNTIVGNTSDGVNVTTSNTAVQRIEGNIITDNSGYGINGVSASNGTVSSFNRLDRNTSGAYNLATDWLAATKWNDNTASITQSAEFRDYANNDFRLLSGSPAIANGMWGRTIGALDAMPPPVGLAKIFQNIGTY